MSLKIIGTGRAVPKKTVSNDELSEFVDTNDEWITSRTGIKSRHICTTESLTDLCEIAVKNAISKANLKCSDIDMIICTTISGDYVTPSLSCCVAERLDIQCPAFDINAACSGFIYALNVADGFISTNKAENILIISAEMMSKHVDWNNRATCVLFGDGAGACVVTKGNALKYINLTSNGDVGILNLPCGRGNSPFTDEKELGFLNMKGQDVFKFAVSMIESQSKLALEKLNISPDDVDYFVLHQANKRIIDFAIKKLKQPKEKFPINIQKYGNISSASVPIMLDEMIEEGKIVKGTTLLLSAFGGGLTTGTCVMIWE